jgi:hypothetical protein
MASMPARYTVHPEHIRSLASMPTRYTVHPEHKKALIYQGFFIYSTKLIWKDY